MSEIYLNDYLKITEDKLKSIFKIELSVANEVLINSLIKTQIIKGATVTDDYKSIRFKAQSVKPLLKFIEDKKKTRGSKSVPINVAGDMVTCLSCQLDYLISKNSYTILGYSPENIIVINDKKFAFLGSELVTKIEDELSLISYPFTSKDFYVSPELINIRELPSYVHYKTAYFSLACLIIFALFKNLASYVSINFFSPFNTRSAILSIFGNNSSSSIISL